MADQQVQQITQELGQLTKVLREMVNASSRTVAAQQANVQALIDKNEEVADLQKKLTKGKKLSKEQERLVQEAITLKKKEIDAAKEFARANSTIKTSKGAVEKAKATNQAQKALETWRDAQRDTTAATNATTSSISNLSSKSNLTSAAIGMFGASLVKAAANAKDQLIANNGVIEGSGSLSIALLKQQAQALQYSDGDSVAFAKNISANRQMVNAMGGTSDALKSVDSSMTSFVLMTGSRSEAFKALAESMSSFAKKGITPTEYAMRNYTNDVEQLAKLTGMQQDQSRAVFEDMASDVSTMELLRSARKEERESILANQRAMFLQNTALGMTTEQAKEATKALAKIAGQKPIDRIKQAARIRALGGALGIEGANEAADAVLAGKRATAEQQAAYAKFGANAANISSASGMGDLGTEIFTQSLLDKLDLDKYYGAGSVFSTTTADSLKPQQAALDKLTTASQTTEGNIASTAISAQKLVENTLAGNNLLAPIVSGIASIALLAGGGKLLGSVGSVAGRALGGAKSILGIGGAAAEGAAVAGAGAAGAGVAGSALSKLGTLAKGAGVAGSALDAGMGLYDLSNGQAQTTMSGLDYLSPMRYGMYAGDKINQGAASLMGGQSIGSKVYDWLNPDAGKSITASSPIKSPSSQISPAVDLLKKTSDSSDDIKTSTKSTSDNIALHLKKTDTSNDMLKKIVDMTEKQVDLAERQLIAMTLSDKEKADTNARSNLRKDNKFASQYNYL
jgi:hypothetical protein